MNDLRVLRELRDGAADAQGLTVDDVIARAHEHPLGIDFLLHGQLGCVAVSLGAHAFTVEAARAKLLAANA